MNTNRNSNQSLKDMSDNAVFKDKKHRDNIPAYNDDFIQEKIDNTKRKKEREKQAKKDEKIKAEKLEYKNSLNKFSEINDLLLIIIGLSLVGAVASIAFLKFNYMIYCVITAFISLFVGKRLKPINDDDNILQTLMWNLSCSIDDFFEYKIKFDMKSTYVNDIAKYTTIFAIISALFNSNTILYPISLAMLLLTFIIAFACKDLDVILEKKNLILGSLIGGFLIKGFIHSMIRGVLVLDLFNLALAIGFIVLFHLFEYTDLSEPKDE